MKYATKRAVHREVVVYCPIAYHSFAAVDSWDRVAGRGSPDLSLFPRFQAEMTATDWADRNKVAAAGQESGLRPPPPRSTWKRREEKEGFFGKQRNPGSGPFHRRTLENHLRSRAKIPPSLL